MKKATRVSFGEALAELGRQNDRIVALDADLAGGQHGGYGKRDEPDGFDSLLFYVCRVCGKML